MDSLADPTRRLPPELLDMILRQVPSEHFKACSSVCTRWRNLVLPLLLSSVLFVLGLGVDYDDATADYQTRHLAMFLSILDHYPGLNNSISEVHFKFGVVGHAAAKVFFPYLLDVLSTRCKRVKTLSFKFANAAKHWHVKELLSNLCHFTEVESVWLYACAFRAIDLHTFSSALPQLKSLTVGNRFVVDKRQSSQNIPNAQVSSEVSSVRSLTVESLCDGTFFDSLQAGSFRNITILSVTMPWHLSGWPLMRELGAYVVFLGSSLKHLEIRCAESPVEYNRDMISDFGLDFSKNSSLQSLVLDSKMILPVSLARLLKRTPYGSLRHVMLRVSQLRMDILGITYTVVAESLPSSIQELYFFDPWYTGSQLAYDWEGAINEALAPVILRGVEVSTMRLTKSTADHAYELAREWRRRAEA